ncbi:hypothetical protein ACFOLC_04225 [Lysobacter cavernae]|uniref:DUF975 family protein n=1 Tax=Lysobacter cavernae TaxID=1685901 RepID=A0ABV7RL15_9GAMM
MDDSYSLLRGGPAFRLTRAVGLHREGVPTALLLTFALLLIVLVPMVVATAAKGTLTGGVQIPLFSDPTVIARFLIAMPLLVLAAPAADERIWHTVQRLRNMVAPEAQERFDAVLQRLRGWRDANLPEIGLFVLAVAGSFLAQPLGLHDAVSDWRTEGQGLSLAGQWLVWVGMPVFRFLNLLWLWRLGLWVFLLWQYARMELSLHAAHPDGRGGLAFLGYAQRAFAVLALVGGLLLAGSCVEQVLYYGATLGSLKFLMGGYVVLVMVLLVAPLLLLSRQLLMLKQAGLLTYGALGTDCSERFEEKWLGRTRGAGAPILEAGDSSALTDLTGVYGTVNGMSVVPFDRNLLISLTVAAASPLLAVVLVSTSVDEIITKLLSILV